MTGATHALFWNLETLTLDVFNGRRTHFRGVRLMVRGNLPQPLSHPF